MYRLWWKSSMDSDTFLGQPGDSTAALDCNRRFARCSGRRAMSTVGRMKLQSFLNYCSSTSLLILYCIENHILSVYNTNCLPSHGISWSRGASQESTCRGCPYCRFTAIDIFCIEILYVSNSFFWCRCWREFSCKCIESAICACPHDRPHINALKYSWIILLYNHIKHTLRFI